MLGAGHARDAIPVSETLSEWGACRLLFQRLLDFEGRDLYARVLRPWLRAQPQVGDWLRALAASGPDPTPGASHETLWNLYALSRINDLLLQAFQPERGFGFKADAIDLSRAEYLAFAEALGLSVAQRPRFSPFHHEIVGFEQSPYPAAPATLRRERWPCLMLGTMLFSRAGVDIVAGVGFARAETVERAPLYWAFVRRHRVAHDLSHGWGSNSQWSTEFRRDFHVDGEFRFNVDELRRLDRLGERAVDEDGLSRRERIELLTHRMFVLSERDGEMYPYDDSYACADDFQPAPMFAAALPAPGEGEGPATEPPTLPWLRRWRIGSDPERGRSG